MRVLAIDYGDRHIGIAVSDLTGTICGDAFTLDEHNAEKAAERVLRECAERGVEKIILGLPKNMDGSLGFRAEKSLHFAEILREKCAVPVVLWDERLTTVTAHKILSESGHKMKKQKKIVDAVAATVILDSYLRSL